MNYDIGDILHWRAGYRGDWKVFALIYGVRGLMVLTLLLAFAKAWRLFGPVKADVEGWRRPAAKVCAKEIQNELRDHRGAYRSMTCLPFEGDSSDAIFNAVRNELLSSGSFDVKSLSFSERVRNGLNLSLEPTTTDAEAARRARGQKSDVALCGAVRVFERTDRGANVKVEYRMIDAANGSVVFEGVYNLEPEVAAVEETNAPDAPVVSDVEDASASAQLAEGAEASNPTAKASFAANIERIFTLSETTRARLCAFALWTLVAFSLPVLTFRFLEGATALKSNAVNFFTLLAYLVADAVFARFIIAPNLSSQGTQVAVGAMAFCAFWYNARVMAIANRRSEPSKEALA